MNVHCMKSWYYFYFCCLFWLLEIYFYLPLHTAAIVAAVVLAYVTLSFGCHYCSVAAYKTIPHLTALLVD